MLHHSYNVQRAPFIQIAGTTPHHPLSKEPVHFKLSVPPIICQNIAFPEIASKAAANLPRCVRLSAIGFGSPSDLLFLLDPSLQISPAFHISSFHVHALRFPASARLTPCAGRIAGGSFVFTIKPLTFKPIYAAIIVVCVFSHRRILPSQCQFRRTRSTLVHFGSSGDNPGGSGTSSASVIRSGSERKTTCIAFGYVKGGFTGKMPVRSAFQKVIVGGLAATAAFFIARWIA
jgi:hypothetical protein